MIPTLAFGDHQSITSNNINHCGDFAANVLPKITAISAINKNRFEYAAAGLLINELQLLAYSSNGILLEREVDSKIEIIIPNAGTLVGETDKFCWNTDAGGSAVISIGEKIKTTSTGGGVGFTFSNSKMTDTYRAMTGLVSQSQSHLETRIASLNPKNINYNLLFKALFSKIDAVNGDAANLQKIAIDDSFYRLFVGLLHPTIFETENTYKGRRPQVRKELQDLCEWLRHDITKTVSLTDMERRTGLSARVLQYSFEKAYGLSPKRWLRRERLYAAHSVLLNQKEPLTLTALAYDFAFSSPSEFTQHYQQEFGELPSQTIRRLRREALNY